jgi:uncharacterized caspase-like protein
VVGTGRGSLIAYATAPNDTAADGTGRNSPYTQQLLRHLTLLGVEVSQLFKKVGEAVYQETTGGQQPWVSHFLIGDFYFVNPQTAN